MKKTKSQSGITLIALIITILVLLILAGVAIKSIQDGGVVTKAQQAADKYTQAQNDELAMLDSYVAEIEKSQQQVGAVAGLKVGDYMKYDENGDGSYETYIVLHNDKTEGLQIVPTELKGDLTLKGLKDFENRFQKFNAACAPYVNRKLGAIDGRVLGTTFNEINSLKNENTTGIKVKEGDSSRLLEIYGTGATGVGPDATDALTVLPKIASNIGTNKVWCSTVYLAGSGRWDIYYLDLTNSDYFDEVTMVTFSAVSGEENTVAATETEGMTAKILPIILIDARIKIEGGTGTIQDPYTYTFNVQ